MTFLLDPSEWIDSDMDGVGDNGDAFPNDPDRQVKEEQFTMLIFVALFTVVIVVGLILLLVGWKRGGDDDYLTYLIRKQKNSDNNTNETWYIQQYPSRVRYMARGSSSGREENCLSSK